MFMIVFSNLVNKEPFSIFQALYEKALSNNQKNIEACAISSFNHKKKEVSTRFVNIKHVNKNSFTFYSNYNSSKAGDFESHNQVSMTFYWNAINLQIRIKAHIKKSNENKSDAYFLKRNLDKNRLAILSDQSKPIKSYEHLVKNFKIFDLNKDLTIRPKYWGGYDCIPYYFEFWEGHEYRLNKREVFEEVDGIWLYSILQP